MIFITHFFYACSSLSIWILNSKGLIDQTGNWEITYFEKISGFTKIKSTTLLMMPTLNTVGFEKDVVVKIVHG